MRGMPEIKRSVNTISMLRQDIEDRTSLIRTMVGTLYPNILSDECHELRTMIGEIKDASIK